MPASKALTEHDIAVNQFAIKQAKTQAVGHSVLKALQGFDYDDEEEDNATQEQNPHPVQKLSGGFEDDIGGVGYVQTGEAAISQSRGVNSATEKLRKQMLGKRARAPGGSVGMRQVTNNQKWAASKPRPRPASTCESSDDEGGRSGLGKASDSKLPKGEAKNGKEQPQDQSAQQKPVQATANTPTVISKKRTGTYLDQVLAERAAKKKKKLAK